MTFIATDIRLEDITTDEDPPCEVLQGDRNYEPCGEPSVVRIRFHCHACEVVETQFYCQFDYSLLQQQRLECEKCGSGDYAWCES